MFILKKGNQPGVYVPLRALFLVNCQFRASYDFYYTPGIYADGYIVFAFPLVRSSIRMFDVRS